MFSINKKRIASNKCGGIHHSTKRQSAVFFGLPVPEGFEVASRASDAEMLDPDIWSSGT
jgi:hypothetical protein